MQFPNWNLTQQNPSSSSSSSTIQPQPQDFLNHLQTQFSNFLKNFSPKFPTNPHPIFTNFIPKSQPSKSHNPNFASLSNDLQIKPPLHCFDLAMSTQDIEERLSGVPVYALSNSNEEFVLVSGVKTGKSLGLFCFNKDDADSLLEQMKSMDPGMRRSSKVVAVALNKVFQLKLNGVAFRFVPDSSQIKNAIKVKESAGQSVSGFSGVPVFQSKSLILKSEDKRYRPAFFTKEDLDKSLKTASDQSKRLNPALRQGDIQVSVLEDIINAMKESSTSKWDNIVFIPPGFDLSSDLDEQERPSANA